MATLRTREAAAIRRVLDIIVSGSALVLLSPVMLLTMQAIWIESGRPIFFSQTRLGALGRHFRIYKFRKFRGDCGCAGRQVTVKNDDRMTQLGRWLEKSKIDELPQLWNVLKGDMTIVGPRPESLGFADCFTDSYLGLLDYTPGLFGPNQIFFRSECTLYPENADPERFYRSVLFPLKAAIDLVYFPSRTFASDCAWFLYGFLAVLGWRTGALKKFSGIMRESTIERERQKPNAKLALGASSAVSS